jgi:hypothetical protein
MLRMSQYFSAPSPKSRFRAVAHGSARVSEPGRSFVGANRIPATRVGRRSSGDTILNFDAVTRYGVPGTGPTPGQRVDARDLRAGDLLLQRCGDVVRIKGVRPYVQMVVYNLNVADSQSYAVGSSQVLTYNDPDQAGAGGGEIAPKTMPPGAPTSGDLAGRISGGHAFDKHVIKQAEYPGVTSQSQFGGVVQGAIENATAKKALANGRYAWWHDASQTVVIFDPKSPDLGTAFRPKNGKAYFDNLKWTSNAEATDVKLTGVRGHEFEVQLSYDELLIVNNALNEVCNGIEVPEFHARIGASLDDVQRVIEAVGNIIETAGSGNADAISIDGTRTETN